MRIIGLDPGTAITGFGVIEGNNNKDQKHIAHGQIKTSKDSPHEDRLLQIEQDLTELIKTFKPDYAAIEKIFFHKNVTTAISVAQARGVLLLVLKKNKIPIHEYTPLQVKQGLTGYGRAEKNQIQETVKLELKLNNIPQPDDAADGLALAIICMADISKNF